MTEPTGSGCGASSRNEYGAGHSRRAWIRSKDSCMQLERSPAKHERSSAEGEPDHYILYEVRCPCTRLIGTIEVPCGTLWYRREAASDSDVHQIWCRSCGNLILYRIL